MAVAGGLTAIREALTALALARVDVTGQSAGGFIGTLDSLDAMVERWDVEDGRSPADHYRLGLMVGMLAHMAACKVTEDGDIVPIPIMYPKDDPVAVAAEGMRDAILLFTAPGVP